MERLSASQVLSIVKKRLVYTNLPDSEFGLTMFLINKGRENTRK